MIFQSKIKIIHRINKEQTFNKEVAMTTYYISNTMGQSHDNLEKFKMINVKCFYKIISTIILQHNKRKAYFNCEFDIV